MVALTIESWLKGKVDFNIPETTIASILFDNNVDNGTYVEDTSLKQRELCLADLYMWLSKSSTSSTGESESDGGWQHTKSVKNIANRGSFSAMAQSIYRKWNSEKATITSSSNIVIKNLY